MLNTRHEGITIYDVAKQSGVSATTVSRVLSNTDYPVSEATRRKVIQAAETLGYVPKRLHVKARDVIVMIPNLTNPYYATLVSGLEASLRLFDMNMVLMVANDSLEQEIHLTNEIAKRDRISLILSPVSDSHAHIGALIAQKAEVIMLEQYLPLECTMVRFNYAKGGEIATKYLIGRGHRRIAFVSSPLTKHSRREVFNGYLTALKRAGIARDDSLIQVAGEEKRSANDVFEYVNGMRLTNLLLDTAPRPDAIFCANDLTALGVLCALHERGLRIPEDISLIGFDNIHLSQVSNPPLTTVDQCIYELGSIAAEFLNANLKNPDRKHVNVLLEPKLIERASVR